MSEPVTLAIVGAGKRGAAYAQYAIEHPDLARVVAVAEPRLPQRQQMAAAHHIAPGNIFTSWQELAAQPRLADAVLICTQDRMHLAPVEALAPKKYAILLEKPMATTLEDCRKIIACVKHYGNLFAVCHVLLYTQFTRKLKSLLDSGLIGDIASIQHLEPVAWWHQAHSYVRGNWRNEREATFMLMAKSCHDIDWLRHIMGRPCQRVASFGSLRHFRAAEKPAGAADRCLDCGVEATCPYSAKRFYLTQFGRDRANKYFVSVITDDHTPAGVEKALREGPYGRCVYSCDNDVVDHQVVILDFDGLATASFTMTAFTPVLNRQTRLFGTRGYIETDSVQIKHFDFVSEQTTVYDTRTEEGDPTAASGHGGGDYYLMKAFVEAVKSGDQSKIVSGPDATLESHRIVFAAEQARRSGSALAMSDFQRP